MWMFQPRTDHTWPNVAGWSVRQVTSGQWLTALSRCIEPSGPSEPALAMAAYTRSIASRAAAASSGPSAPRMIR
ncbi:hypothetical protein [Trebonia kvetii]|uniref:hypothetical protein n=1 Tax=Trebonia kvetii TaxID=2480626 RepID=UPI001C9E371F|nr:hypothetical protein [Trebonia kvetii]